MLYLSPAFFALLAAVSPDVEARVAAYWDAYRAASRERRLRNAAYRAGLPVRQDPPPPGVVAVVDAEEANERREWAATRAAVEDELRGRNG